MRRIISAMLIAGLVAIGTPSVVVAQDDDDVAKKVESLSKQAAKKYRAGEYEAAIELFKEAYDLEPVPNLLFNIAKVYEKLEDWDNAIKYYEKFIVAPDVDSKAREIALERIDTLKEVAKMKEDKEKEEEELAEKKEKKEKKNVPPPPPPEPDYTWSYVTLGTGIVLLAGGGVFGVLASQEETNFVQGQTVEQRRDARDTGQMYALIADGMYIAGGLATLTGIILFVTASPEEAPDPQQQAVRGFGWFDGEAAGVGFETRF